jgi:hypothetical protein
MMTQLNWGKVMAWVLIAMMLLAAVGYAVARDYRKALYWFFAACVSVTVTV